MNAMSRYLPNLPQTTTNTGLQVQSALNKSNFTAIALTAVVKKVRNLPLTWRGKEIYMQWVNETSVINARLKENIILAKFEPVVIKLRLRQGKHKNLQSDVGTSYKGYFKIMMKTRKRSSFQVIGTYNMDPEILVQSYIESGFTKRLEKIEFGNGIKAILYTTINVIGQNFFTIIHRKHVLDEQNRGRDSDGHSSAKDIGHNGRVAIDFPARANKLKEDVSCSSPAVRLYSEKHKEKKKIQFRKSLSDITQDMLQILSSDDLCDSKTNCTQYQGNEGQSDNY